MKCVLAAIYTNFRTIIVDKEIEQPNVCTGNTVVNKMIITLQPVD